MSKKAPNKKMPPPKATLLLLGVKPKNQKADEVQLVPFDDFKTAVKKVLSVSKTESDKELVEFQAANAEKRKLKKGR
jgi:hypothetical protein